MAKGFRKVCQRVIKAKGAVDVQNQIYSRFLPTLLSEMGNCRFCRSDLQPFFANTPKQNAQIVDCVDLRIADLQSFFANTPKRNAKIVDCVDLRIADLQPFFADTPKQNAQL